MTPGDGPVIVVGAGMAGLACARALHAAGRPVRIYEAGETIGGRVATDEVKGFRLDRGFQVLLTAYPEARRQLDYAALHLRPFYAGAVVRWAGGWHRVADPRRHPGDALRSLANPIGTLGDKLRVARLPWAWRRWAQAAPELSALDALQQEGFSPALLERFFRPFLAGVFLEGALQTNARKLADVMRSFAAGDVVVPARGMAEIPRQLAGALPVEAVHLRSPISRLVDGGIQLASGALVAAPAVVVATAGREAARLLEGAGPAPAMTGTTCLYFSAAAAPPVGRALVLNAEGGPINHLAVMSAVSADYAPAGQQLVSVNVVDPGVGARDDVETVVRQQLRRWFGDAVEQWEHLRTYHLSEALPFQPHAAVRPARVRPGVYVAGDHCGLASLDTALRSGAAAAAAVCEDGVGRA